MSDDHREDGNCPNCGAALNEYGTFEANYSQCNKCDTRWSIIDKPIEQFCFDKCPKCNSSNLQQGCGGKRLCNDCSWMWVVGDEENGKYNTEDGKAAPCKGGCGGCCGGGCCGKTAKAVEKSSCSGGGCCSSGLNKAPTTCASFKGQASAIKAAIEAAMGACSDPGAAAGLAAVVQYIDLHISLCGG